MLIGQQVPLPYLQAMTLITLASAFYFLAAPGPCCCEYELSLAVESGEVSQFRCSELLAAVASIGSAASGSQQLQCTGLVSLRHMGASRDQGLNLCPPHLTFKDGFLTSRLAGKSEFACFRFLI